jgi:hypothetical protein
MVTAARLKQLLDKRPFRPFRITMSSGESYEVRHPEMALVTKPEILVGIDVEEGVPADFKMCSLLHVTAVEPLSAPTNGKREDGGSPVSAN